MLDDAQIPCYPARPSSLSNLLSQRFARLSSLSQLPLIYLFCLLSKQLAVYPVLPVGEYLHYSLPRVFLPSIHVTPRISVIRTCLPNSILWLGLTRSNSVSLHPFAALR